MVHDLWPVDQSPSVHSTVPWTDMPEIFPLRAGSPPPLSRPSEPPPHARRSSLRRIPFSAVGRSPSMKTAGAPFLLFSSPLQVKCLRRLLSVHPAHLICRWPEPASRPSRWPCSILPSRPSSIHAVLHLSPSSPPSPLTAARLTAPHGLADAHSHTAGLPSSALSAAHLARRLLPPPLSHPPPPCPSLSFFSMVAAPKAVDHRSPTTP